MVIVALITAMVAPSACSPAATNGPGPVTVRFGAALAAKDLDGAARLTTTPEEAKKALRAAFEGLQARGVELKVGQVRTTGATSEVEYEYVWDLPAEQGRSSRTWDYRGTLTTVQENGEWKVRWAPSVLHPRLGANQSMVLRALPAAKAPVNSASGGAILVPGVITRIRLEASKVAAPTTVLDVAGQLVRALQPIVPDLDPVRITEQATSLQAPYVVASVNQEDLQRLAGDVRALPGVTLVEQADMVPTDRTFAPALMSSIKKNVTGELDGTDGWEVVAQADTGARVSTLSSTAPEPKSAVKVSISPIAQAAAQAAVNTRRDRQSMMVVIQPSTGSVLAVAQNPEADKLGSLATSGLYPPGSTGKIVTATAAIEAGIATPDTIVPCPGTLTIGEREVPNYNRFSLGDVTMQRAFARSCNTSFAFLGAKLKPEALPDAAAQLGIGPDYTIPGLPVSSGQYPLPKAMVNQVEDSFGQGEVLVSPFAMALAVAAVAHGGAVTPQLLLGKRTEVEERPPLDPRAVDGVRAMMREVVASGTAELIRGAGDVLGKTGEAEVDGGSHAWFVGYRGDLAFATLVVLGGSSDNAVAVTKEFFDRFDAPVAAVPG
ncbi:penicillin-binding transpeptidase domain-containing protein [Tsukamurella sp. PLM1]|uniref:penicillin-binding transpeptidase domain-containing protein n=1 Tax=Tsukamurella sp. PLM1 TaxID=2929795 RepID=UPI00205D4C6B|nr:penicillin-binding transpeptidase domain-containing protein [Tsukamurella sp. PLM1]BDH56910.1 penicillin-binding protein [Tsukamurella sp. PLM1]